MTLFALQGQQTVRMVVNLVAYTLTKTALAMEIAPDVLLILRLRMASSMPQTSRSVYARLGTEGMQQQVWAARNVV